MGHLYRDQQCLRYNLACESFRTIENTSRRIGIRARWHHRYSGTSRLRGTAISFIPFPCSLACQFQSFYFILQKWERPRRRRAENNEGLTTKIKRSSRYNLKPSLSNSIFNVRCYDRLIDAFVMKYKEKSRETERHGESGRGEKRELIRFFELKHNFKNDKLTY